VPSREEAVVADTSVEARQLRWAADILVLALVAGTLVAGRRRPRWAADILAAAEEDTSAVAGLTSELAGLASVEVVVFLISAVALASAVCRPAGPQVT